MEITLSTCFVLVHDPDLALAFYRDALGLEQRNDVAREDFRWITVGAASQPGVVIVLTNYLNGSPADGDALAGLIAKGALNGVHFHTDDLDATFETLRASGPRSCKRRPTNHGARVTAPSVTRRATSCASTSRLPPRPTRPVGSARGSRSIL
jgi:catechol 2,3-dioxygenase-like lactoylglutathione lyase family enzyme